MMDVKKDLIFFRNNQSSDGEILAHTGSQTKATKEFNEL